MRTILSIALILASITSTAKTSTYTALGNNAQQQLNETSALKFYAKALKENPKDMEALTKASIMCSNIGNRSSNDKSKESYYNAANIYAKAALKINARSADANFAMALYYARKVYTVFMPKTRIELSAKIKTYAERAIHYNPIHFESLTLLGLWHYERATLTSAEKRIVSFLGGLPKGSLQQAEEYLNKSNRILRNNITTLYALGKVYQAKGLQAKTITIWKKALQQTNHYQDDATHKQNIRKKILKLKD